MGTTCKDNLKICYCLETNNSTNIDKVQNIESRLLQFGDFLEDRQYNEKIPEQIQNFITENKFSSPNNLNINENIYLIRPLLLNNGNIYKGNWNENIQKHGYGEYYIEKEKKFIEGIWYNDRITYGRIFYSNNDLYEGFIDNFLLSLVQVTNIKEILKKEKGKELENIFFLTKQYIMVNLKIINSMEKEFWNGQII